MRDSTPCDLTNFSCGFLLRQVVSEPHFVLGVVLFKKKKMARRRQQRLEDVYDREAEQRRLDQRMDERFERMME